LASSSADSTPPAPAPSLSRYLLRLQLPQTARLPFGRFLLTPQRNLASIQMLKLILPPW